MLLVFLWFPAGRDKATNDLAYDIILVMGQSNTHYGYGYDPVLDAASEEVLQLGRFDGNDYKIIPAVEPLDHRTKKNNHIGFALTLPS